MTTKEYPELFLCRFTKAQRAFIRKEAKLHKLSEAGVIRGCLSAYMITKGANALNKKVQKYVQSI
jgi:hypothetical protein